MSTNTEIWLLTTVNTRDEIGGGQATGCKAADDLYELWEKILYQCFQEALSWDHCAF